MHHDSQAYQDRQNAGNASLQRWSNNRHDLAALHELSLERAEKEKQSAPPKPSHEQA